MKQAPFRSLLLTFLFSTFCSLFAEVQQVTVTWNPSICDEKCGQMIGNRFRQMKQIQEVSVNPSAGVAVIKWSPDAPFSYHLIKTNMQMVGAGVNEIRVRVRGKATVQGNYISLVSQGDNSRFVLISPIMPTPDALIVNPNPYMRDLDPKLQQRILRESSEGKIMVIEGPLYQPARSPPLQLIVERIQVEKQKQE